MELVTEDEADTSVPTCSSTVTRGASIPLAAITPVDMKGSLESQAFRKHFGELSHAIRDPEWLASELFSEGMISNDALDDAITVVGVSVTNKTRRLLCHFKRMLAGDPGYFHKFISILKSAKHLDWISNRVEATYSELSLFLGNTNSRFYCVY